MSTKKQINIYLPEELFPKLKQLANCWGESVNGYLNWQIRCEVEDFERLTEGGKSLERAELIKPELCYRTNQTCYLEYFEYIPKGGDEADLSWDWTCSNCDADLTDRYEDLDIKTPKELGLFHCPHCGAKILGTRYRKDDDSER